jgi:exodeoxyribonuclease-3
MKKILSWNVNGLRAMEKKGFLPWFLNEAPDILCLQETKAHRDQLADELTDPPGYTSFFAAAKKRGYSGVAVYSKDRPLSVTLSEKSEFDDEGRALIVEYPEFTLLNGYFPNSQEAGARLDYKLAYCAHVLDLCKSLVNDGKHIVVCGDYNIAHREIDLANPKSNQKNPGFLPEERAWMDEFTGSGFVDTFRNFTPEPEHYTWWSYRLRARERNVGWRIDYHCVDEGFMPYVESSVIRPEVMGSDHCPVEINISV